MVGEDVHIFVFVLEINGKVYLKMNILLLFTPPSCHLYDNLLVTK